MTGDAPRADEPSTQPPPGTVKERWFERSAFKAAVATVSAAATRATLGTVATVPASAALD